MVIVEILDILVCPACKNKLVRDEIRKCFLCHCCNLKYADKDDIPVFILSEAEPIDEAVSYKS